MAEVPTNESALNPDRQGAGARDWPPWGCQFPVMAGPCSVESREQILATARALKSLPVHVLRGGVWKPRSRPGTFEGVGEPALVWLREAAAEIGRPAAVEVGHPRHVELALGHGIQFLWIGARTTANPFLMDELASALRGHDVPILVKNPVSPDLSLWLGAIERLERAGVRRLIAVHRGFSVPEPGRYRNAPLWRIALELRRHRPEIPVWCDPSHMAGRAELVPELAAISLDLLYDGWMIEVHVDPTHAKSDAAQQLTPAALASLLSTLQPRRRTPDTADVRDRIEALRHQLDELDAQILDAVAARMEIVRKIAAIQKAHGVAVFQPDRWRATLERYRTAGLCRGLPPEFLENLYELLHEEALRQKTEAPPEGRP